MWPLWWHSPQEAEKEVSVLAKKRTEEGRASSRPSYPCFFFILTQKLWRIGNWGHHEVTNLGARDIYETDRRSETLEELYHMWSVWGRTGARADLPRPRLTKVSVHHNTTRSFLSCFLLVSISIQSSNKLQNQNFSPFFKHYLCSAPNFLTFKNSLIVC